MCALGCWPEDKSPAFLRAAGVGPAPMSHGYGPATATLTGETGEEDGCRVNTVLNFPPLPAPHCPFLSHHVGVTPTFKGVTGRVILSQQNKETHTFPCVYVAPRVY